MLLTSATSPAVASWVSPCYALNVSRTISQREFRNNSAEVMNAVEGGETVIVSRNGVPVAELRPIPRRALVATAELKRAWADGSRLSYAAIRAEMDELFGDERIDD